MVDANSGKEYRLQQCLSDKNVHDPPYIVPGFFVTLCSLSHMISQADAWYPFDASSYKLVASSDNIGTVLLLISQVVPNKIISSNRSDKD